MMTIKKKKEEANNELDIFVLFYNVLQTT